MIATWNGAAFDLPFIADRAHLHGLDLGLRLQHDPAIGMRRAPLPRSPRLLSGRLAPALPPRRLSPLQGRRGAGAAGLLLTQVDRRVEVGLAPIEVDRERIHDLSHEALHAYAASDARLARVLTERRWPTAARFVDRVLPLADPGHAATA